MRRMNSMLLGHHGASGRTDCMYFWMARRVAPSSHDSGRCTIREGTSMASVGGSSSSALASRSSKRSRGRTRVVVVDVQGADAGREVDDAGDAALGEPGAQAARGPGSGGPGRGPSGRIRRAGGVPVLPDRHRGAAARLGRTEQDGVVRRRATGGGRRRGRGGGRGRLDGSPSHASWSSLSCARASASVTRRKRTRVARA